jgi:hypothetical protein
MTSHVGLAVPGRVRQAGNWPPPATGGRPGVGALGDTFSRAEEDE